MKYILGIAMILTMIGTSIAAEITFSPDAWKIKPGCLVAVDVMIDTAGQAIAATDVVVNTTLEYIDFVPTKELFPHFFPPIVNNSTIHIIGFISNPKATINGSWSIGKLFLRQKNDTDIDGKLTLYFAGTGKTHDSNLSILWWIDILEKKSEGMYNFVEDATCAYPADYDIVWWFSHMAPEDALNKTIKTIQRQQRFTRRNILPLLALLITIIVLFVIYKKRQHSWKTA